MGNKEAKIKKPKGQSRERLINLGLGIAMIAGFMWFLNWLVHMQEILPLSPLARL